MHINYNHLYYFHVVATAGSQTAAARQLRISPSTISEQLKHLEAMLGVALFDRTSAGLRLNDNGQRCLEFTEVMFNAADRLLQTFEVTPLNKATVSIGISSTVSRAFATEYFLPLFDEPGLVPKIRHAPHTHLLTQLSAKEIDVALTDTEPRGRDALGVSTMVAARPKLAVVAHPEQAASVREFPADLARQRFVQFTEGSTWRVAIDEFLRRNGIVVDVIAETDDLDLLRLAACRSRGFASVPNHFVASDLERGDLVCLGQIDVEAGIFVSYLEEAPTDLVKVAVDILTRNGAPKLA